MLIKNGQGFLESEKVEVFPSAYRGYNENNTIQFDPKAKLNLEENFIKAGSGVNNLIQSYIIDWTADTLMCMIAGYSFKLNLDRATLIADPTFQNKNVYLKIKLRQVDALGSPTFVLGDVAGLEGKADLDNSDPDNPNSIVKYFTGLAIIPEGTQITEPNTYTLRILKDNGEIETLNTLPHIVSGSGENSVCANRQNINPYYKDAAHNGESNLDRKQEITDNDPPIASGGWSFAANRGQAEGVSAAAFGVAAAKGPQSFAAGGRAEATEAMSVAFNQAKSNAQGAFAVNKSTAEGDFSAAFNTATVTGENSFAVNNAIAAGIDTIACNSATANGDRSTAIGTATADGEYSFAGGGSTQAIGNNSFAFGSNAARKSGLHPSKIYPVKAEGMSSIAIGRGSRTTGIASFAAGELANATANYAIALGFETTASGEKSFSTNSSKAQGSLSAAFNTATADGENSVAFNSSSTNALNAFTANKGEIPAPTGNEAAAFNSSFAAGTSAFATGSGVAQGSYSFAGGIDTHANKNASFAIGTSTIANADSQVAIGKYNIQDDSALFVIGNGTADENRKNALVIATDGKTKGDFIGTFNGNGSIDYAKKLDMIDYNTIDSVIFKNSSSISGWVESTTTLTLSGGSLYFLYLLTSDGQQLDLGFMYAISNTHWVSSYSHIVQVTARGKVMATITPEFKKIMPGWDWDGVSLKCVQISKGS